MIKYDGRQQAALERFFKEETTWFPEHVAANLVMCILVGVSIILLFFPTFGMDGREDIVPMVLVPVMLYNFGMVTYGSKFTGAGSGRMWELLRYLPVTRAQIALFKMRKVWRICLPLTAVILVFRNLFSIAFYHGLSVYDFLIPLAGMLLLPMLLCLPGLIVGQG
jgi:predicted membrane channel-forming protein YqfA (hemolysin III family)